MSLTSTFRNPLRTNRDSSPRPAGSVAMTPSNSATDSLPLGERLLRDGRITSEEVETAMELQSNSQIRFGEALIELGFLQEDELLPYLSDQLGIQAVRLRAGLVDPVAVALLPRAQADRLTALPLFRVHDTLTVAMGEPQDLEQRDELQRITHLEIRPVLALHTTIERMISDCYDDGFVEDPETSDTDSGYRRRDAIKIDIHDAASGSDESPVIRLVNYVIVHAVRQGASDIHIEPGDKHSVVRFRVDGVLREVLKPRSDFHPALVSRIKVMAKLDIANTLHTQAADVLDEVRAERDALQAKLDSLDVILEERDLNEQVETDRRIADES